MRNIEMCVEFLSRNYRYGRPDDFAKFFSVERFCMRCVSYFLRQSSHDIRSHIRAGHKWRQIVRSTKMVRDFVQ